VKEKKEKKTEMAIIFVNRNAGVYMMQFTMVWGGGELMIKEIILG